MSSDAISPQKPSQEISFPIPPESREAFILEKLVSLDAKINDLTQYVLSTQKTINYLENCMIYLKVMAGKKS